MCLKMQSSNIRTITSYNIKNIFSAFYLVYYIFPSPKDSKARRLLTIFINYVIFICLCSAHIVRYYLISRKIESVNFGSLLSAAIFSICCIGIRFTLIKQGMKIKTVLQKTNTLYLSLLRHQLGKNCIESAFFVCWIIPNIIFVADCFRKYKYFSANYLHIFFLTFCSHFWDSPKP